MKRIIFVNLHKNGFLLKPFSSYILKKVIITKQQYLLKYLLENGYQVYSFLDERGGSACLKRIRFIKNHRVLQILNAQLMSNLSFLVNEKDLDLKKVHIIKDSNDILNDDIVIGYSLPENCMPSNITNGKLAFSMIHFYGDREMSTKIKNINPDILFAESRLDIYSKMFRKNYQWYNGKVTLIPFIPEKRFGIKRKYDKRLNKVLAIGTLTTNDFPDFFEEYHTRAFQPQRELLYENRDSLKNYIDCYISKRNEEGSSKEITGKENAILRAYKRIFNLLHSGKQKRYFSFDMVDKFNEYKMFICPEDAHYNPGIGFVEGMACGCAYIGQTIGVYEDYGMREGVHYIGYDGSLENLKEKIQYYQIEQHQEELRKIAQRGYKFVQENFTVEKSAQKFVDMLEHL